MTLNRRQLLAAGGASLASCGTPLRIAGEQRPTGLDELLAAHADALPERGGAGANHYPMAAEALEALGQPGAIDRAWVEGVDLYAGPLGRARAIESEAEAAAALGDYARFGDWLDHFRGLLERGPWRAIVARWASRLAPGICAAAFHGVIRTGHAARALRRRETAARRNELAVGLAYWACRYAELPAAEGVPDAAVDLRETLARVEHPWLDDRSDVSFDSVVARLQERPLAPRVSHAASASPRAELDELVREGATAFLEMLVAKRHRIWCLHMVTGPAAVEWLLPEVDGAGASRLVAHARQATVAMHAAYGEPYAPRAHLRPSPPAWPVLIRRVVDSRSVHGIKLIDALARFDRDGDPLWRSVGAAWLDWT